MTERIIKIDEMSIARIGKMQGRIAELELVLKKVCIIAVQNNDYIRESEFREAVDEGLSLVLRPSKEASALAAAIVKAVEP